MTTQLFTLNIPDDMTVAGEPDKEVVVKVYRFDNGDFFKLEFLGVTTELMCSVTCWIDVHQLARERSDIAWNSGILTDVLNHNS